MLNLAKADWFHAEYDKGAQASIFLFNINAHFRELILK